MSSSYKIYKIFSYSAFFIILLLSYAKIANTSISKNDNSFKLKIFEPVINLLHSKGVDSATILRIIFDPSISFNEKFVRINVTNFASKTDYKNVWSRNSVIESMKFINENSITLQKAEDKFKVPKEIITSILWVETKFGKVTGNHNVLSVYLSTALASQSNYIQMNRNYLITEFEGDEKELSELDKKLLEKTHKKTEWAIKELLSLIEINKKKPNFIFNLKGSWAGAFGYPQFLPSSYLKWAYDGNGDNVIDLFNMDDAIFSVANYLKSNGWGSYYEQKRAAVFHYNNSNDYVKAIFKLADKLKPKQDDSDSTDVNLNN